MARRKVNVWEKEGPYDYKKVIEESERRFKTRYMFASKPYTFTKSQKVRIESNNPDEWKKGNLFTLKATTHTGRTPNAWGSTTLLYEKKFKKLSSAEKELKSYMKKK